MPVITCHMLAQQRFGNALFIYVFARAYALAMGCELQTPYWIGQDIFQNVNEAPISVYAPGTELDTETRLPVDHWFGQKDVDVRAYCQHQRYLDFYTRTQAREWLKLKPEFESGVALKCAVGHRRLGDYMVEPQRSNYCCVNESSYHAAAEKFGVPRPLMFIHEGWRDHGLGEWNWLVDFLLLRNSEYLFRANSSFSWWAATLGNGKVFSPVVGDKTGPHDVEFVEGNWPCTAGKFRNQSDLHLRQ